MEGRQLELKLYLLKILSNSSLRVFPKVTEFLNTDASNVRSFTTKFYDSASSYLSWFMASIIPERFKRKSNGSPASQTEITQEEVTYIIENYRKLIDWVGDETKKYVDLQKLIEFVEHPFYLNEYPENPLQSPEDFQDVNISKTTEYIHSLMYYKSLLEDIERQYTSIKNAYKRLKEFQDRLGAMKPDDPERELLKNYIARSNGYQKTDTVKTQGSIQKEVEIINHVAVSDGTYIIGTLAIIMRNIQISSKEVDTLIGTKNGKNKYVYEQVKKPDLDGYS